MRLPNPVGPISRLAETFYTVNQRIEQLEDEAREVRREVSALRIEHSDLKTRVAVLEEARKTTDAQVRAIIAETVADLRIRFAESQSAARAAPSQFLPPTEERQ